MEVTEENRVLLMIGTEPIRFDGNEYSNANIIKFEGEIFMVSHRAIMTVVTSSYCNAACGFCSNEVSFTPRGKYLSPSVSLERAISFARLAGVNKIAITGGEPTLNPQALCVLVKAITPGFSRVRMHTNGFGLLKELNDESLIENLAGVGLTGLSISVAHPDQSRNQNIMRFKKAAWDGLSERDLAEIALIGEKTQLSLRLSCVLTPEGVWTAEDIMEYIGWGRGLGYHKFIFRSASNIPLAFSKETEFTVYNRDAYRPIHELTPALETYGFGLIFQQHKSDSHVHVYDFDGVTVDIDESSEELDPDLKIRRINFMPDGITYKSWIDPLSNIFANDGEGALRSAKGEFGNNLNGNSDLNNLYNSNFSQRIEK